MPEVSRLREAAPGVPSHATTGAMTIAATGRNISVLRAGRALHHRLIKNEVISRPRDLLTPSDCSSRRQHLRRVISAW
ncbi:MAG: hypothetical protein M3R07_08710, partial [Gemmatimonadota bacterium]|nr:hypothetical protein [Gemmatimonadota bacterium]